MKFLSFFAILALSTGLIGAGGTVPVPAPQQVSTTSYLITNDDLPGKVASTSGTFYTMASDGTLQNPNRVTLGGAGAGGGYFTANRVSVLQSTTAACAYLSLGGAGEIGAVDIQAQQDIGNFSADATDVGIDNGIGLANNGTYVYASFSTSNTIATFAVLPGCGLSFLGDISPIGKHLGHAKGMCVHGNLMVVAYGDGSIESFDLSAGIPVSHGDLQDATGYTVDRFPTGVDITEDGHYAIFGDVSAFTTVEVSDISSGKLTKTLLYNVGTEQNSNNVLLSPDETLLYIANTGTGKITAAFFDKTTGKITTGCTSATLKGFDSKWVFLANLVTQLNTGTGSVLYAAEKGSSSGVAMVNVSSNGGTCSLTEATKSPIVDPNSTSLLSIGVYPPRSF
jgi:6-phosphogluconolactonase (cycloisomerase 2 family)